MDDLADIIYETAFVPEQWGRVLEETTDLSGSASAQLFVFSENEPPRGRAMPNTQALFDEFISGDVWKFCDSAQRMCSLQPGSFVNVDDFLTSEQIEQDPARIQLRKAGIGAHLCSAIALPTGEIVTWVFQRWLKDGNYDRRSIDRLDALRPHLARASLVSARLKLQEAKSTVATLQAIGLPAAVLSASGNVRASNALLDDAADLLQPKAFGAIRIARPDADKLFQAAVKAAHAGAEPTVRSIPVPGDDERTPAVVHVLPLRRSAHDIFSGADTLVAVTTMSANEGIPSQAVLGALFDLSPTEARVAMGLAGGLPLKTVAAGMNIAFNTARRHLDHILQKTGTHQQSALVSLLKGTRSIR
jgi:DNA-binding CsgD family transcriptional regulator